MQAGVVGQAISQQSHGVVLQSVSTEVEAGEVTVCLEGCEERRSVDRSKRKVREVEHGSIGTRLEKLQRLLMTVCNKVGKSA